jgi:hypothetical protein
MNAAISAGDFYVMERLLQRAEEERAPLPRLMMVEVSPDLLAGPHFWAYSQNLLRQFTLQDTLAHAHDILRSGNTQRALGAQLNPVYSHRLQLCRNVYETAEQALLSPPKASAPLLSDKRFHFANKPADQPAGAVPAFVPQQADSPDESPVAPAPAATGADNECLRSAAFRSTRSWVPGYQINDTAAGALRRILEYCRRHHVAVLLVQPPHHSLYREQIPPSIRAMYRAFLDSLCAETGCRFVDLEEAVADDGVPDLVHCNLAGNEQCARALVHRALRPILDQPVVAGR